MNTETKPIFKDRFGSTVLAELLVAVVLSLSSTIVLSLTQSFSQLTMQRSISQFSRQIPNEKTLTQNLLFLVKKSNSTKTLLQIHSQMIINSIDKPNYLLSKLIDLKDFNYAHFLFNHIRDPNDYAFNVMIHGLANTWERFDLSLEFYYKMKFLGIKGNNFTYPFLFISCGHLLLVDHGRLGHATVLKNGLCSDCYVRHSLITMYARCWEIKSARKVFDEITDKDSVSWNSMISGYVKMGFAREAVELFREMRVKGFVPDEMTLVSVLGACGDLGDLSLGKWIEGFVVENKMRVNSYVGSSLIDMYAKCGELKSARDVFDRMKNKDSVTWNAMITGYAQNGLSDEAISLFNAMRLSTVNPDNITVVVVLSACASIGALEFGHSVYTYASEQGIQYDIYVGTALIDMYAKCGNMEKALSVFKNMPKKNEVSWNAMISALAFHGKGEKSLELFNSMLEEKSGICPNNITFVAVLSACVHSGLVDEGRRLFNLMTLSFGLVPEIEHYSCMVDLLARSGKIYEAWDFIQKMPRKPDVVMLGSLLGACRKVKNIDISEKAIKLLLEMEPSNSGNYVISSKIYEDERRWGDAARMRALMREKGVVKTPGCSWIEVNTQVHEFHAGDSVHMYSKEIDMTIELLYGEMELRGYRPNIHLV